MSNYQNMHKTAFAFLILLHISSVKAQDFSGTYNGIYNGDPVVLTLASAGSNTYKGTLNDTHLTYEVAAQATGKNLKGTCSEKSMGLSLEMTGILNGSTLSLNLSMMGAEIAVELKKAGAAPKPATAAASTQPKLPAGAQHDPALIGRWVRQSNYNSGYGQGSMSSESVMILLADGRLSDGGSRTVTSGSDWSGTSSQEGSGVVEGVLWYNKGKQLFLQVTANGKTETQLLGSYYIEHNNMLVTGQDGTKVLFYRG